MNDINPSLYAPLPPEHRRPSYRALSIVIVLTAVILGALAIVRMRAVQPVVGSTTYHRPFAGLEFEKRMNGKTELVGAEAVAALDTDIGTVAKQYDLTAEELKTGFKNDSTLRIDANANIFISETGLLPQGGSLGDGTLPTNPAASAIPDSQTFLLHSRPGAAAKIYINFKGATVTNPVWNGGATIVSAPYSVDTDTTTFSATELNNIKAIWRSVAEDYAAFNIDVTTDASSTIDPARYIQVIIAPSSTWYCGSTTACTGGIAYVGSFTWGDGTPAWVFSVALTNDTKLIAEAVSHESGHALGLSHSSQYDTACTFVTTYYGGAGSNPGWAPIMGNSYYKGATQWVNSAEAQTVATPYGCTSEQDQISIISSQAGVGFAPDETGATAATSQNLPVKSNTSGINTVDTLATMAQNDTDLYKVVSTGGDMTFTVGPITPSAALLIGDADFRVRLLDNVGVVIAEANPNAIAAATVAKTGAAAGTYYLEITPSGYLDYATGGYSAAASMGSYQVSGSYAGVLPAAPDSIAPTVSLISPLASATLAGLVTLAANASDDTGVDRVTFYRGSTVLGTDTSAPYTYSWDSKSVTNGSYSFTAAVYDAAGNTAPSTSVTATVNNPLPDTTAPQVKLTTPVANATVTGLVPLTVTASDATGIAKVAFFRGTTLITEATTAPYSASWDTAGLASGTYSLTAKAYDPAGNIGTSATVSVKVPAADKTVPVVTISKPKNGATVTSNVTISASATDNIGITKLELYIDGTFIASSSSTSLNYTWSSTITKGNHTILVKAYDKSGNIGQKSITVKK